MADGVFFLRRPSAVYSGPPDFGGYWTAYRSRDMALEYNTVSDHRQKDRGPQTWGSALPAREMPGRAENTGCSIAEFQVSFNPL
jgi:hypothetical protein